MSDVEDEEHDWRFLNQTVRSASNAKVPNSVVNSEGSQSGTSALKRGEKDFAPNDSVHQNQALSESRNSMYAALDGESLHLSKHNATAEWVPERSMARVIGYRGPHFTSIGVADSTGTTWLNAEEMLYLLERGSLRCYWPVDKKRDEATYNSIPMTLETAYSVLTSTEVYEYHVYSYLKKLGFHVARQYKRQPRLQQPSFWCKIWQKKTLLWPWVPASFFARFVSPLFLFRFRSHYTNFRQVYNDINFISCYQPDVRNLVPIDDGGLFTFYVWKPNVAFKKSQPPVPDFRIAVKTTHDRFPTLQEMTSYFAASPVDQTYSKRHKMQKLKEGFRSIVIAVVDSGVINFVRLCDVSFALEPVHRNLKK